MTRVKKMSRRILLVEDEAPIRDMLNFVLEQSGFTVDEAEDFDIAFEKIKEPYPDLILLDWMLPGGTGVQLAKKLKSHEYAKDIPVIMLTAKSSPLDHVTGINAGARHYLTKPINHVELLNKVISTLGIKR